MQYHRPVRGPRHACVGDPNHVGNAARSSLRGIGRCPHSGIPGAPTGPRHAAPSRCERRWQAPEPRRARRDPRCRQRLRRRPGVEQLLVSRCPLRDSTRPDRGPNMPRGRRPSRCSARSQSASTTAALALVRRSPTHSTLRAASRRPALSMLVQCRTGSSCGGCAFPGRGGLAGKSRMWLPALRSRSPWWARGSSGQG